jgi:hypothetical protein
LKIEVKKKIDVNFDFPWRSAMRKRASQLADGNSGAKNKFRHDAKSAYAMRVSLHSTPGPRHRYKVETGCARAFQRSVEKYLW